MPFVILFYALIVLIGGIIGYAQASSVASLISGIVFGSLLLGCVIAIFAKKRWGAYAALITTFVLDGFFTFRFLKYHKFMPSGLMSIISFAVLVYLAWAISR